MTLDIVSRVEWGARTPRSRRAIATPTRDLWLHHTAGNEHGPAGVRQIQSFHMDTRKWSDIAYSFLIDPDDLAIYEGRGAGVAGGHTAGHNTTSHAICILGNFEVEHVNEPLLDRIAQLVAHGHQAGWWPDRLTGGHRDASGASTACPGRHLQAQIRTINARAEALLTGDTPMPTTETERHTRTVQQALIGLGYQLDDDGVPGPITMGHTANALPALIRERTDLKETIAAQLRTLEEERRQHATTRERLAELEAAVTLEVFDPAVDAITVQKAALLDRFTEILYEIAGTRP